MADERGLLVAGDPCDRHGYAEEVTLADDLGRSHHSWEHGRIDPEEVE